MVMSIRFTNGAIRKCRSGEVSNKWRCQWVLRILNSLDEFCSLSMPTVLIVKLMRFLSFPAASCEHPEVVKLLLARGANKSIKDTEDLLPEETTTNEDILKLFKMTG